MIGKLYHKERPNTRERKAHLTETRRRCFCVNKNTEAPSPCVPWQHAKMAIGHIHDDELGDLWGVIADSIVGKLLAGENLIIMGTDATGKKTLFRVDGSGMYAYNSRFWMESANGGAFAIDPSFGLGLGQGNPFVVGDDGTIVPKCINPATGELKLDKDGFPVGMNFWAGMDGQVYIRGKVFATGGQFTGDVTAKNFYFNDGNSVRTLISKTANGSTVDFSDLDYIDLGGIVLDGKTGNINFTGAGSITWGNNTPVKYQFGTSLSGPWHDTMQANDKYRRDSLDGGTTWGAAYQFKGTDGKNGADGSDAKVPAYIQSTYIDATKVESFQIRGNKIEAIIPPSDQNDTETGFILNGSFDGRSLEYLRIYSYDAFPTPITVFTSPQRTYASWDFPVTNFYGTLDFSSAKTRGLHCTLA